ncbi:MAG: hypothetical protein AUG08_02555 [Acidobacteria bacterium 13_1_20CM_2_55_15]|nr:MAG: hypothetical protein AUH28_10455 [Acidobacteria bacterium 13_1_40CM_56_16]OLD16979.1 MAG: hypothetical protein AUI91_13250 [Acidobacteria bacterium 13_1_40CM_3_56_11]OLD69288.1 MAG: hypothetical protein AUI45_08230 [Acidobacteria bacterium 13_1_40CM_2_56_11]OLE89861.1 MAG: hypothetical protein AUG08_02555 [Acidobacteria bacterium 13_1_20CM_2_55_15]PYR71616.1 MAG: hypothetical protein DMG20_02280 [Acidobacteriota bacterium]
MSLLETCASVAIISAVVFFAAPSLIRARENYQLDLTARQVAGKMAWTRIKAISRSRNCRLRLISNVSYVIECGNSAWQTHETVTLPRGFQLTATAAPQFHKHGNAAPAGTITIWDRRMNSRRVVVNFTGRINVE